MACSYRNSEHQELTVPAYLYAYEIFLFVRAMLQFLLLILSFINNIFITRILDK
jgi:hypothetical protein